MNAYSEDLPKKKIVEATERATPKTEGSPAPSRRGPLLYQTLRRDCSRGPLAPKRRPGSKPKLDERARKLLEADLEEQRPAAILPERREFLERVAGVQVSDSTVSRMLRRLGWSRKKDRWERLSATSS